MACVRWTRSVQELDGVDAFLANINKLQLGFDLYSEFCVQLKTQSFIIIMLTSSFIHSSYNIILVNFCSQYLFHIFSTLKVSSFGLS